MKGASSRVVADRLAKDQFSAISAIFGNKRGSWRRDDDVDVEVLDGTFDIFLPSGKAGFGQAQTPPVSVLQRTDEMLTELASKSEAIGISSVVDGWFIQVRRVGESSSPEGLERVLEEFYEFFDEYEADGVSCVFGDLMEGRIAIVTPQMLD